VIDFCRFLPSLLQSLLVPFWLLHFLLNLLHGSFFSTCFFCSGKEISRFLLASLVLLFQVTNVMRFVTDNT
jgi:hypothetical protein